MNDIDFKQYELMVILPPDMNDQDLQKHLKELRSLLGEHQGTILHEDPVGMRDLAYRIKKHDRGFYTVFNFEHDPAKIPELEKTIRIETPVMRHALLAVPKHYFFKTMKEYENEAEAARLAEEQQKKTEKPDDHKRRPPVRRTERVEKPEAPLPAKEVKEEPSEQDMKKKLQVEEEKLQSLLDNPDIQI